jgi:acyl-lipid omega-6 desaturase (Delta-12 desaturase)
MSTVAIPSRERWKQTLAPYLQVDRRRSLGQLASAVLPYLAVWALAAATQPSAPVAIALGLVATVFLMRAYSLFHDLTHNSLFESRRANAWWGHALGFLLFTPYRWWQRQHALHHAHTGDLDHRGVGEINTMTVAEYEDASRPRRLFYRLYRNPLLMLLVGPSLVFLFERRFPQRGMTPRILVSVVATNLALVAWVLLWSSLVGWGTFLLIQGTTLVAGGAVAAWMLYIQHQYEDTYYQAPGQWRFELAALQGSSYLQLPRPLAWAVGNANFHHVHHLSAKIPNYNLRAAHESHPMFRRTPVVTIRGSIATFRLKLWDTESESLVPFPARRAPQLSGIRALVARPLARPAGEAASGGVVEEAPRGAEDRALYQQRQDQLRGRDLAMLRVRRLLFVDQAPHPLEGELRDQPGQQAAENAHGDERDLHVTDRRRAAEIAAANSSFVILERPSTSSRWASR